MSFLAIVFSLLLEQARPFKTGNRFHAAIYSWVVWVRHNFDAGRKGHAWWPWWVAVAVPALVTLLIHWGLMSTLGWPFALLWSVAVLYATLGFRQFSHHFTTIRDALVSGDESLARQIFAQWQQVDASQLPKQEIVRHLIEHSVIAAHRHVLGVISFYSIVAALGLGPAGAVIYRMAEFVTIVWNEQTELVDESIHVEPSLENNAKKAWEKIDWLPARMTAFSFAVVGNFEDAMDSWRNSAHQFKNINDGLVLAATSGAINIRLGGQALQSLNGLPLDEAKHEETTLHGRPADFSHMSGLVGLLWRTVVMWVLLLALLTLAKLLG
ncbi:MAG: CobD/CbiB family protein [Limnohabitans sp.]|nr:CobD/CbiB family protein [Limnohabitans sp.]